MDRLDPDVTARDHAVGPADAPLTLVAYGDYECAQCARAHLIVSVIVAELGEAIRFVFRHFPVSDVHANAQRAAEAAESVAAHAGDRAFWSMHAMLFENQDALEEDDLLGYAEAAGADPAIVADDLASLAMQPRVRDDFHSGLRSGVGGTPTFFVNGRRLEADWSDADAFTAALTNIATNKAPSTEH